MCIYRPWSVVILKYKKYLPGLEEFTVCSGRPLPLQQSLEADKDENSKGQGSQN